MSRIAKKSSRSTCSINQRAIMLCVPCCATLLLSMSNRVMVNTLSGGDDALGGFEMPIVEQTHTSKSASVVVTNHQQPIIAKEADSSKKNKHHKLRYDWTNMPIQSDAAKFFHDHQRNCDLPLANMPFRGQLFGLGSDLHVWSQAVCNAAELKVPIRLKSILPWIWSDESLCNDNSESSPLTCYFPNAEYTCDGDKGKTVEITVPQRQGYHCEEVMKRFETSDLRAGGIEYLFSSVSPILIQDAERQLNIIFPDGVPPDLITVHVRWGDKRAEMKLVSIEKYIRGVEDILKARNTPLDQANIFLATEDPLAVNAFREKAPARWNLFVDQYHEELKDYRDTVIENITHSKGSDYNQNARVSEATKGKAGLIALGSLLVAMEANDFVLTTASNWSRLMNELRKNVVQPRCDCTTHVVDLKNGEW